MAESLLEMVVIGPFLSVANVGYQSLVIVGGAEVSAELFVCFKTSIFVFSQMASHSSHHV